MSCAVRRFARALERSATREGAAIEIETHHARSWFSATFAGHRHAIEARAPSSAALDRWLDMVTTRDLPLAGELVADLRVDGYRRDADGTRFRVAGLTVETP